MRSIVLSIALLASVSVPAFAQEWIEFASREDRFTCNFPSQPTVTQTHLQIRSRRRTAGARV